MELSCDGGFPKKLRGPVEKDGFGLVSRLKSMCSGWFPVIKDGF